jgi:hypothetical protein
MLSSEASPGNRSSPPKAKKWRKRALPSQKKTRDLSGVFSLASLEIDAAKSVSPELIVQTNANDVILEVNVRNVSGGTKTNEIRGTLVAKVHV